MPQLRHYAAEFARTWRADGPGPALRDAACLLLRPWHAHLDRRFDGRHGIHTDLSAAERAAAYVASYEGSTGPYQPTSIATFRGLMAVLPRELGEFTFVDFGSGKGRTLLLAAGCGFRRIVGVELDPALHEIAQANVALYARARSESTPIELVNADAAAFDIPSGKCVLYFYNPFDEATMARVLAGIERAYAQSPRKLFIVYLGPRFAHLLDGLPFLRPIARRRFALHRGAVYESLA